MNHFKLFPLSSALILTINSASANYEKNMWDVPYVGLMLSYESGSIRSFSKSDGGFANIQSAPLALQGFGGEFVAGWGKTFDKYYLGLEALASLYNSSGTATFSNDKTFIGKSNRLTSKAAKKDSLGLVVRGGYKVHKKTLLYAKIGTVLTRFNLTFNNVNTEDFNENFTKTFNKRLKGLLTGLGTEIILSDRILGRLEASHVEYGKDNIRSDTSGNSINARFKLQSNEIKAGVIIPW